MQELSPREKEVLLLAAQGCTASETALKLDITIFTAKRHRENILRKMRARNITQAVVFAYKSRLF